ncbi:arylsulfatase [Halosquirtibacter xylanolyticus]|uniref:sulfatase family protein n=1 Tax=Halosquirtibacter xylanolyticus TaxID=3374599 RepID=UPI003748C899|nr:arylsulfatase [Prolixibacteraceae bacterium]
MKSIKLYASLGLLMTGLAMPKMAEAKKNKKKPNIVYILADDMGYGDVKAFNPKCQFPTPNLDQMAKGGMMFTDVHTNSSVCTPTRYGILTGRYCWRTRLKSGVLQGHSDHLIDPNRTTVASYLKKKGYQTACVGKWHLGMDWTSVDGKKVQQTFGENVDVKKPIKNGPLSVGFDYYFGIAASLNMAPHAYIEGDKMKGDFELIMDRKEFKKYGFIGARNGWIDKNFVQNQVLTNFTDKTISWIEQTQKKDKDKPFFVYMPLNAPHSPIVPNKQFKGKSGVAPHGDFCMEVDYAVGRVMKALDKIGILDNTLVIFTADNGVSPQANLKLLEKNNHFSSYFFRGTKGTLYEGGHHVPFIAHWPNKVKSNKRSDYLMCTTDLLATVSDLMGDQLGNNEGEDSYSFLPALYGKNVDDTKRQGVIHHSDGGYYSIRQGDWKLVLHEGAGSRRKDPKDKPVKNPGKIQLFNMQEDPYESNNLLKMYPDKVKELELLMAEYINNGRSTPGEPVANYGDMTKRRQLREIKDLIQ